MSRLVVDRQRCEGHGICAALVPDLLELDDDGTATTVLDEVPPNEDDDASLAVDSCPAAALRLASG